VFAEIRTDIPFAEFYLDLARLQCFQIYRAFCQLSASSAAASASEAVPEPTPDRWDIAGPIFGESLSAFDMSLMLW